MAFKHLLAKALSEPRRAPSPVEGLTRAAVLVPIVNGAAGPRLLFMERAEQALDPHSGQVCFPGGRWEPEDGDVAATALREAREELGVPADAVEVLGRLGETRTPSGYAITPVVGWIETLPELKPDAREVADCFHVAMSELAPRENAKRLEYHAQGRVIWGATARIAAELLVLAR